MKKEVLICIFFLFIIGCSNNNVLQENKLSEFQVTACDSADIAGTCDTRLEELGVVTKEECCESLGKCCQ